MSATERPYSLPAIRDDFYEHAMQQPMRAVCARCGNDFHGTAQAGKDWFRLHRCICKPERAH